MWTLFLSGALAAQWVNDTIREENNGTLVESAANASDIRHTFNTTEGEGHHDEVNHCYPMQDDAGANINTSHCERSTKSNCFAVSGCYWTTSKGDLDNMDSADARDSHHSGVNKTHEADYTTIGQDSSQVHASLDEVDHANPNSSIAQYAERYPNQQDVVVTDPTVPTGTDKPTNHKVCKPCQPVLTSNKATCDPLDQGDCNSNALCFWIGQFQHPDDSQLYDKPGGWKEPCFNMSASGATITRLNCPSGSTTQTASTCWCDFADEMYHKYPGTCTENFTLTQAGKFDLYKDDKVHDAPAWGNCDASADIACEIRTDASGYKHLSMTHKRMVLGHATTNNKHRCFATSKPSDIGGTWMAASNDCRCECKYESDLQTDETHISPHTRCQSYYDPSDLRSCQNFNTKSDCENAAAVDSKQACWWSEEERRVWKNHSTVNLRIHNFVYNDATYKCDGASAPNYIDWLSYPIRHADNLDDKANTKYQDMTYELSTSRSDWCKAGLGVYSNGLSTDAAARRSWCKASNRNDIAACAALGDSSTCGNDARCHWGDCRSAQQKQHNSFESITEIADSRFCDDIQSSFCPYGQKPMICEGTKVWDNTDEVKYYEDADTVTWSCVASGGGVDKAQRCACPPGETLNKSVWPYACTMTQAGTNLTYFTGSNSGGPTPVNDGPDTHG